MQLHRLSSSLSLFAPEEHDADAGGFIAQVTSPPPRFITTDEPCIDQVPSVDPVESPAVTVPSHRNVAVPELELENTQLSPLTAAVPSLPLSHVMAPPHGR